ncbi:GlsB/YeaQ/YmgE family stress response membrane protein [Streptomyces sp. NPDC003952]
MGIISWITLGFLAGTLAKLLMPGRDPGGIVGTTVIGIVGALTGGWLSEVLLDKPIERHFFDLTTWGAAIGGSLVLLVAYRILFGSSRD